MLGGDRGYYRLGLANDFGEGDGFDASWDCFWVVYGFICGKLADDITESAAETAAIYVRTRHFLPARRQNLAGWQNLRMLSHYLPPPYFSSRVAAGFKDSWLVSLGCLCLNCRMLLEDASLSS